MVVCNPPSSTSIIYPLLGGVDGAGGGSGCSFGSLCRDIDGTTAPKKKRYLPLAFEHAKPISPVNTNSRAQFWAIFEHFANRLSLQ
jgi:hypothetical protein